MYCPEQEVGVVMDTKVSGNFRIYLLSTDQKKGVVKQSRLLGLSNGSVLNGDVYGSHSRGQERISISVNY